MEVGLIKFIPLKKLESGLYVGAPDFYSSHNKSNPLRLAPADSRLDQNLPIFAVNFRKMKVFKFGGASVSSTDRIRNVAEIIQSYPGEKLLIVISAMGKTTNALEKSGRSFL